MTGGSGPASGLHGRLLCSCSVLCSAWSASELAWGADGTCRSISATLVSETTKHISMTRQWSENTKHIGGGGRKRRVGRVDADDGGGECAVMNQEFSP